MNKSTINKPNGIRLYNSSDSSSNMSSQNSNDWTLVTNKKQKKLASIQPYNTEKITIKRNGQTYTY